MKRTENRGFLLIFLTGILVFGIPLLFLGRLSEKMLERTRETSSELVREKILQELPSFKKRLSPEYYLKHLIENGHKKLLPEVTPDLLKLFPAADFGKQYFNADLPEKFATYLKNCGLNPLLVVVNSPGFSDLNYWYSHELQKQIGKDARLLAISISNSVLTTFSELFSMNYQRSWAFNWNDTPCLAEINKNYALATETFNRYISRFSNMQMAHDQVCRVYSDYFSRQFIYCYTFCCISPVNAHGAYTIYVTQDSFSPEKLIEFAENNVDQEGLKCKIVEKTASHTGFEEENDRISITVPIPTKFYFQLDYWCRLKANSNLDFASLPFDPAKMMIEVSAVKPKELAQQLFIHNLIRLFTALFILCSVMFGFHSFLFGFRLPIMAKRKLAIVLTIITILPVLSTGVLSFYLLNTFDRVLEKHLSDLVNSKLSQFICWEDESRARLQSDILKIKLLVQNLKNDIKQLFTFNALKNCLPHFRRTLREFAYFNENGEFAEILKNRSKENKFTESLLGKYLVNQGLSKMPPAKAQEFDFKVNLTMGLLEKFLTPEREESISVNEGTLQKEITHPSDIYISSLLIVKRNNGENLLIMPRISNNVMNIFNYLMALNAKSQGIFFASTPLGDVSLSVRLRGQDSYKNYIWPGEAIFSPDMVGIYDKALKLRANGKKIIRDSSGITINAWVYRPQHQAVYAVIGKTRRVNFIELAILMVFPVSIGYSLIILILISNTASNLLLKPVEILKLGISRINQNNFGVTIEDVEVDELKKVAHAFNEMSIALKQKQLISRYVSDKLLENLNDKSKLLGLKNENSETAILASDIRGFTSITESHPPFEVVDMLNSYFTVMEEAIKTHNGIIDKYIGDAIQAIFYPDSQLEPPIKRACAAALEMRRQLKEYNKERASAGKFIIENGIGIAFGKVVSCTIGAEAGRKTFSVTGKPVQQAAYLESLSLKSPQRIVVCSFIKEKLEKDFEFEKIDENAYALIRGRQ